jgi:DNA-binding beta-propeller fold protein YncE
MHMLFAVLVTTYRLASHIPIPGDAGWDYVAIDSASHRGFIAHGDRVDVLDLATRKLAGSMPATGAHGTALAPELKRGFYSNGRANSVSVFDYDTLKPVAEWKTTGENPDAILYDAHSKRLFTFNGRGKNATVFNATTGDVVATIDLGGKPEFAVSDGKGNVYVNIEDTSELAEIDAATAKVTARWPLKPCEEPSGLAIDRAHGTLFSVCDNKTMVISHIGARQVVDHITIGSGVDGVAYDPDKFLAFSSNGADGTMTIVNVKVWKVVQTLATAKGARTIGIDPATHHLYLPFAKRAEKTIEPGTFEVLEVAP